MNNSGITVPTAAFAPVDNPIPSGLEPSTSELKLLFALPVALAVGFESVI